MNKLSANDKRPKAEGIDLDFPVEVVDCAVSNDREDHVEALWRDLLVTVDRSDERNSFTTNDTFAFADENFNSVFLK